MTDLEFMNAVQETYHDELERTGDPKKAHKAAERFRVSLRLTQARAALRAKERQE